MEPGALDTLLTTQVVQIEGLAGWTGPRGHFNPLPGLEQGMVHQSLTQAVPWAEGGGSLDRSATSTCLHISSIICVL